MELSKGIILGSISRKGLLKKVGEKEKWYDLTVRLNSSDVPRYKRVLTFNNHKIEIKYVPDFGSLIGKPLNPFVLYVRLGFMKQYGMIIW